MGFLISEGLVQIDIPASGGVLEWAVIFFMGSFVVKMILNFIKSLPFT